MSNRGEILITDEMIEAGETALMDQKWTTTALIEWLSADLQGPGPRIEEVLASVFRAMQRAKLEE